MSHCSLVSPFLYIFVGKYFQKAQQKNGSSSPSACFRNFYLFYYILFSFFIFCSTRLLFIYLMMLLLFLIIPPRGGFCHTKKKIYKKKTFFFLHWVEHNSQCTHTSFCSALLRLLIFWTTIRIILYICIMLYFVYFFFPRRVPCNDINRT